jgi:predicted N-formylglutamate amidohydrolase
LFGERITVHTGMSRSVASMTAALLVSCEHAGNTLPPRHAQLAHGNELLLNSHRGWDPGARELAEALAYAYRAPLFCCETTRLLVEVNRSSHRSRHLGRLARDLACAERERLVAEIYRPYRAAVTDAVQHLLAAQGVVLHILVHSFTPELDGQQRRADVAWLYDPRRAEERLRANAWRAALAQLRPDLQLRRNYPYRGTDDGLELTLRRQFSEQRYLGLTLEVNQALPLAGGAAWQRLCRELIESCAAALAVEMPLPCESGR